MLAHSVTRRAPLRLSPCHGDRRRHAEQLVLFPPPPRRPFRTLIARAWLNGLVLIGAAVVLFVPARFVEFGGVRSRTGHASPPPSAHADGEPIAVHIRAAALRYGVPEKLIHAVIAVESEFNPDAVSRRGAAGLMQLMPGTAATVGVRDRRDAPQNIDGGVRHLRALMDRFGNDLPLVLAAYNAGEQPVALYGGVPPYPETRRFVVRVLRRLGDPHALETVLARSAPPRRRGRSGGAPLASSSPHGSPARTLVVSDAADRSARLSAKEAAPQVAAARAADASGPTTGPPSAALPASAPPPEGAGSVRSRPRGKAAVQPL